MRLKKPGYLVALQAIPMFAAILTEDEYITLISWVTITLLTSFLYQRYKREYLQEYEQKYGAVLVSRGKEKNLKNVWINKKAKDKEELLSTLRESREYLISGFFIFTGIDTLIIASNKFYITLAFTLILIGIAIIMFGMRKIRGDVLTKLGHIVNAFR